MNIEEKDLESIGNPPSLVLIHFPGNVVNGSKAIDMLGGISKISESFPAPSGEMNTGVNSKKIPKVPKVELKFRPNDHYCRALKGRSRPTKKLLFKISINNLSQNPVLQDLSLEGIIDKEVVFEDLCDFQRVEGTIHNETNPNNKVYNLVASKYSSNSRPTPYKKISKKRLEEHPHGKKSGESKRKRKRRKEVFVDYEASSIPQKPDEGTKRSTFADKKLFLYIKGLFSKRPMWLPKNIIIMCEKKFSKTFSFNVLKPYLFQFSYRFRNGPFRRILVKYGIDPRNNSSMAKYQYVDFRPKVDSWGEETSLFFDRPPKKQISYFQICDIRLKNVIDFVNNELVLLDQCKKEYGWFEKKDIVEKIPSMMKEKLNEWIEDDGYHRMDRDIVLPEDEMYKILEDGERNVNPQPVVPSSENPNRMDISDD